MIDFFKQFSKIETFYKVGQKLDLLNFFTYANVYKFLIMTLNIDGFINSKGGLLQCWWVKLRIVRLNLELLLCLDWF